MDPVSVQNTGRRLSRMRIVLIIVIVCGFLLAGIPSLLRARESARKSACINNLKQLGLALDSFARDHGGLYPRIDDRRGNLIFKGGLLYPAYMKQIDILGCPSDSGYRRGVTFRLKSAAADANIEKSIPHPNAITCESYVYLGWITTNEKEGLAAIAAYLELFDKKGDRKIETGDDENESGLLLTSRDIYSAPSDKVVESHFDGDLIVEPGDGNLGTNVIHRLTDHAEIYALPPELLNPEVRFPSVVPVMWEWPDNHSPSGGHVLYLDYHVEFVEYPGKFPMTKDFIETLRMLEVDLPPAVPPVSTK